MADYYRDVAPLVAPVSYTSTQIVSSETPPPPLIGSGTADPKAEQKSRPFNGATRIDIYQLAEGTPQLILSAPDWIDVTLIHKYTYDSGYTATTKTAISATSTAIELVSAEAAGVFKRAAFDLKSDVDCYIERGGSGVVATSSNRPLVADSYGYIEVNSTDNRYLGVICDSGVSGSIWTTEIAADGDLIVATKPGVLSTAVGLTLPRDQPVHFRASPGTRLWAMSGQGARQLSVILQPLALSLQALETIEYWLTEQRRTQGEGVAPIAKFVPVRVVNEGEEIKQAQAVLKNEALKRVASTRVTEKTMRDLERAIRNGDTGPGGLSGVKIPGLFRGRSVDVPGLFKRR